MSDDVEHWLQPDGATHTRQPRPRRRGNRRTVPIGAVTGFWIQRRMGKQKMSLSLTFMGGKVNGEGRDVVGRFSMSGTYDLNDGRVKMTKHYENAHSVDYDGANQGDGMWLWGVWTLRIDRGGFHLWPEGEEDPTQRHLHSEQELAVRQIKRRIVLEPAET